MGNIDYITVKQASELWRTDISTIGKLLRAGRIPGAIQLGGHWMIPKDAPKPGRKNKETSQKYYFRFPFYANFPEDSFTPPLSEEEKRLRQAQINFFACDFDRAESVLADLANNAENIHVKISAVFFSCILSAYARNGKNYDDFLIRLNLLLVQDYPHKQEMTLFHPWLYFSLAQYKTASEEFQFAPGDIYTPACLPLAALFSFSKIMMIALEKKTAFIPDPYELLTQQAEQTGHIYEAQEMHMLLFEYNLLLNNTDDAQYHLRKGLEIAQKHNFILLAACYFPYFPEEYNQMFAEFPEDYAEKIRRFGWMIHESVGYAMAKDHKTNFYEKLSKNDFLLAFYALIGYTNKQTADSIGKCEKTVATRYNEIYEKMNVSGKKELVSKIKQAMKKSDE